jgi:hypothetical protein
VKRQDYSETHANHDVLLAAPTDSTAFSRMRHLLGSPIRGRSAGGGCSVCGHSAALAPSPAVGRGCQRRARLPSPPQHFLVFPSHKHNTISRPPTQRYLSTTPGNGRLQHCAAVARPSPLGFPFILRLFAPVRLFCCCLRLPADLRDRKCCSCLSPNTSPSPPTTTA